MSDQTAVARLPVERCPFPDGECDVRPPVLPPQVRALLEGVRDGVLAGAAYRADSPYQMVGYKDASLHTAADLIGSLLDNPSAPRDVHMDAHWAAAEERRLAAREGGS